MLPTESIDRIGKRWNVVGLVTLAEQASLHNVHGCCQGMCFILFVVVLDKFLTLTYGLKNT